MQSIDDEDRFIADTAQRDDNGWPFEDADRTDPLTALRIAVTGSHPRWRYLVAFDRESPDRPTDAEARMLASYLDEYKAHWYNASYAARLARRPLDVDGGANGVVFRKYGPDDWGYRRQSWTTGPLFFPGQPSLRERYPEEYPLGPFSLVALMDHIHSHAGGEPSPRWAQWKAAHHEVFGEVG